MGKKYKKDSRFNHLAGAIAVCAIWNGRKAVAEGQDQELWKSLEGSINRNPEAWEQIMDFYIRTHKSGRTDLWQEFEKRVHEIASLIPTREAVNE